jgi:hypothetical protein
VDCNRNIRFGTATARSEFLIRDLIFLAESLAASHRLAFKSARPARPVFWLVSCEKFLFYFLVPVHESCLMLSDFSSAPLRTPGCTSCLGFWILSTCASFCLLPAVFSLAAWSPGSRLG